MRGGVCVCLRGGAAAAGRQEGELLALYASLSSKRGCNFLFLFFFFFFLFFFFFFFFFLFFFFFFLFFLPKTRQPSRGS